ncbi:uncharacterized protein CC84DRAFT_1190930 [Paraphaeosphaeria sporulosa]|uniref:Uncharacterized protein n=1 Tax=Paraphaeosphaeria sporulosa TaxID=1460663 RepID=A0A177BZ33_9PLEO|nr:uncharacterized protein CC84DRAFT_1190930 [Paraphaeosphaeria sporulosa]OAG00231.1 hypothetical protein CC84DRAFT_1190930 [Paraphaeosphaeria sporulosa]
MRSLGRGTETSIEKLQPLRTSATAVVKSLLRSSISRSTHCTICSSDLHMCAIGIVEEVASESRTLISGGRVIILPMIGYGECFYCKRRGFSISDQTTTSQGLVQMYGHHSSGIFGYSMIMRGYSCNQAENCSVPDTDIRLVGLADVTPTPWHGRESAEVDKDDVVGRLAKVHRALKVYAINNDINLLNIANAYGMIPIDVDDHSDPADDILSLDPHDLDRGIEANGVKSTNSIAHTVVRALGVESTRKGGNIALIGGFFHTINKFPIGMLTDNAITLRFGQLYAQKARRYRSSDHQHDYMLLCALCSVFHSYWMLSLENSLVRIMSTG